MTTDLDRLDAESANRFLRGVEDQRPVAGLTHNFYRYPARFSPLFARAAIEAFSQPGDVVLDPFMGGATTLVEASALGRHALGSDINSLSLFLARVKTTILSDNDLRRVEEWVSWTEQVPSYHRRWQRRRWHTLPAGRWRLRPCFAKV